MNQNDVTIYGLSDSDVVSAVAKAMEVLSADGAKALDYSADGKGWSDLTGNDNLAALSLWEAVIRLPAEQHLALMWKVLRDNPRMGEATLDDLTCFVAHHITDGNKFGREGLRYWVRHWARRDGSSREAAMLYGQAHVSHQRYYRERVCPCLDGWFVAAKGALESLVAQLYQNFLEAA
ncbi:hypothetical protein JW897_12220 [Chromobacterium alkanivorans]|uniref:hypothetical protein n=1 Tax=Chromobacterium alkanivorans TaxID=1071719 RepID=UPI0019689541|nr:hypothetical protein [Chromobacterium alkanivorans]MBN3004501.1 hypothetical protein [Chromobacterium alkanivorans]